MHYDHVTNDLWHYAFYMMPLFPLSEQIYVILEITVWNYKLIEFQFYTDLNNFLI